MNPLKKLASQTAIYGLSSVVGRLLNYLLVPLYTRYFLPEEYGVVTELYAYVAFFVIIEDNPIGPKISMIPLSIILYVIV